METTAPTAPVEHANTNINPEEEQYISLCERIFKSGSREETRNGTTFSVFGNMMEFDLSTGNVPFMTHKRLAWRTCLTELIWFIRGHTDVKWLNDRGVHIWDANGTREFLDSRGLHHYAEDTLGPVYGYQWRNFNGENIDQLGNIIAALKDPAQRTSRRLIMTAWNPCQLDQMALPPCHILCQFNVESGNKLSCALYQRSGDVGLGVPFNIASYSALTILLAKHCGIVPHKFVYFLGNAHIYELHADMIKTRIDRKTLKLWQYPKMHIAAIKENIEDYEVEDFNVQDYQFDKTPLKLEMIA